MVGIEATLPAEIAAFAAAYTNVMLIPGPSFVVVCEAGLSATRREAGLVAIGVACGAGVLATTILQASPVLRASPGLMTMGRLACALILLAMGLRIVCHSYGKPMCALRYPGTPLPDHRGENVSANRRG